MERGGTTLAVLATGALVAALTGCSGGDDRETGTAPPWRSPCTEFAGSTIPVGIEVGCFADKTATAVYAYQCSDGRTLVSAGPLMGYVGESGTYVPGGAATTPAFRKLLVECDPA